MKALTAVVALMMLVGFQAAAVAQDYGTSPGVAVSCTFDGSTITCTGENFEPSSTVTITASAAGTQVDSETQTADSNGEVTYSYAPACNTNSVSVTMSGTNQDGNSQSDTATVDISSCADNLPQTGGGLALLGLAGLAGAATVRRRR